MIAQPGQQAMADNLARIVLADDGSTITLTIYTAGFHPVRHGRLHCGPSTWREELIADALPKLTAGSTSPSAVASGGRPRNGQWNQPLKRVGRVLVVPRNRITGLRRSNSCSRRHAVRQLPELRVQQTSELVPGLFDPAAAGEQRLRTVRPGALAVLRLINSSNLIGALSTQHHSANSTRRTRTPSSISPASMRRAAGRATARHRRDAPARPAARRWYRRASRRAPAQPRRASPGPFPAPRRRATSRPR